MDANVLSILESLERAIATEMEGYQFYIDAVSLTNDPRGKEMFHSLARDEMEHFQDLKSLSFKLRGREISQTDLKMKERQKGISILPSEESLKQRLTRNPTETEALKIGIDIEFKAVEFYTQLLQKSQIPEVKELLERLRQMEKGHLAIIQGEFDSVTSSGFWCDHREFGLE